MNETRQDPTQEELDFLYRQGFEWISTRERGNQWLFQQIDGVRGVVFDLSAADLTQIDEIARKGLFTIN